MADLLDLLTSGDIEGFNRARDRREAVDLFAADLAGLTLHGVDLSGVNLQKADLTGTDLTGAVLAKADFTGADLTGAILSGVSALKSRWREAYLGEADLTEADLQSADLTEADLTGAKLNGARLSGARFKGAICVKAAFNGADLSEAKLAGADFSEADLSAAVIKEADLSRANLSKARLNGADLSKSKLTNAALREADLTGANLVAADLTAADLSHATVVQADFSRADLTEAVLEGVDLGTAVLTYAEIETTPDASGPVGELIALQIEDPSIAISEGHVGVLWENDEPGRSKLRVLVGTFDQPHDGRAVEVPLPTDAVLSKALVPTAGGFQIVVIVERPGGLVASVADLSYEGRLGAMRSIKMEYTPAVRPVVRGDASGVYIYGISREGPGLQVHKVDGDALARAHRSGMPTVRGFAGTLYPVVLSKGGVLIHLKPEGPGQPMRAPSAFPGRVCAATPMGTGLVLVWLEEGAGGFRLAFVKPGEAPDEMKLLPKFAVGTLDMAEASGRVWVAFTKEDPRGRAPSQAYALRLPEGDPIALLSEPGLDVDEVRFCQGGEVPTVAVSTLEGGLRVVAMEAKGPKVKWTIK